MAIKVLAQIECDCGGCSQKATTTACITASLTISESYYETKTIPDGIDLSIDAELPDGWSSHQHGGYGYGNHTEYRCPKCTEEWKSWQRK